MSDFCKKHNLPYGPDGCTRCKSEEKRAVRNAEKALSKVQPLRFSCLSLAVTSCGGEPHTVLGYAQQFYDFVTDQQTGDDGAKTPKQDKDTKDFEKKFRKVEEDERLFLDRHSPPKAGRRSQPTSEGQETDAGEEKSVDRTSRQTQGGSGNLPRAGRRSQPSTSSGEDTPRIVGAEIDPED